ncbi:MAG TPA: 50S ribosomal protein L32e [Methanothrix sp.]|jgi:large subunit ribosomal protein L32e|nr:50S ribosomal protein L32e [Methanothrix sp.]HOV81701.1 50S ribosomal protein L32e [Methanothrix sp.]HPC89840.1 50S ribosomal protein L32e [Methanothrix sp.]HQE88349.1 50S ribosomal protein L32e [Methanothrix sp.]HQI67649.1 50S ribosomal protein L32e [Methanothrix sp.]
MAERLLRVRARQKSRKPEFNFHDSHKKKRLGTSWRKPRGLHNKLRQQIAAKGKLVRPGFGSPRAVRGFHPCGLPEILVNNVAELSRAEGRAVRIASAVGRKKRLEIEAKAAEAGLKVLNPIGGD